LIRPYGALQVCVLLLLLLSAFCKYFSSVFTKVDVSHEQRVNLTTDTTELDIEFHEEKNI